tara:strand:+ start:183 stop:551 length:369 start_codon:yes stop_codon:yes gene_type:complete
MQIKYKIISCSEEERSIIVRFYSDVITEEELANRDEAGEIIRHSDGSIKNCRTDYNINLFQVPAPTGNDLEVFIARHAPKDWLEMLEKVKDPAIDTTLSTIKDMVGPERNAVVPPEPTPPED